MRRCALSVSFGACRVGAIRGFAGAISATASTRTRFKPAWPWPRGLAVSDGPGRSLTNPAGSSAARPTWLPPRDRTLRHLRRIGRASEVSAPPAPAALPCLLASARHRRTTATRVAAAVLFLQQLGPIQLSRPRPRRRQRREAPALD